MKFIYPAVFRKNKDGGYHAFFPDLECCEASGETLDDAIDNANEACRNWITVELEEEEPLLPYVSEIEDIETEEGDIVRNISVNIRFYEGWDE
ncbi:MAG TPA: type II toxin-antitoxin system HicB family antitoxin [Candidatus Mediterraneibacter tabaqchaliae]|uniref:Type II toxin-antitoxin system HicB family antitoxin n=1 Tax=Candidatus Mediterraneibacter tabaqchaliae TaxID=2838689 RepID=A0A9D2U162_9FIRM|nr:type II toxin-antitoxin system HicB family antitoxin [Candidatus Mediterraneibacter tabaqchaliae]